MNKTSQRPSDPSRTVLFIVFGIGAAALIVSVCVILLFLRHRNDGKQLIAARPPAPVNAAPNRSLPTDHALSNSVTILLGEDESGQGLAASYNVSDGQTVIESINGLSARAQRLTNNHTALNFYFRIDSSFKQQDLARVRFDVEYLDPNPGTMGIHYDSVDTGNGSNPKYREATQPVRLTGSGVWQNATFRTRNDGLFANRENGQSDFRIWAKTPLLYVRRVTVTREAAPDNQGMKSYAVSNQVTLLFGDDQGASGGLQHLVSGSYTTLRTLDGFPCCYLNRINEGRMYGSLYFAIHPSFKRERLKNARVEIEYLAKKNTAFRLQFDGMDGETNRIYQPVLPEGVPVMRFGTGADYGTIPNPDNWSTAIFHITNAVFMNSQREGADFRLEVLPPEIYVRRVTVIRENP